MKKERINIKQITNNKRAKDISKKTWAIVNIMNIFHLLKKNLGIKPPIMSPELRRKIM